MESLLISLNAVVPLFILMGLGYVLRAIHFVDDHALQQMDKLGFRVLIPMMLFRSAYLSDLEQSVNARFLLWHLFLVAATFCVLALIAPRMAAEPEKRGALLQGMYRGNTALLGIAVGTAIFGADQIGEMTICVALTVPLYNVLAVLALEMFRGGKMDLKQTLHGIVTNPLILGCFAGLGANLLRISLPGVLMSPISSMADAASPLAFIVLGASFHMERVTDDWKPIAFGVAVKLVLLPLVAVTLSVLLGFRGVELGAIAVIFAAPTAVSSFTMAQQMGADADLSAALVVFTGMLSCFTIFLWIFVLLQMGLLL